MRLAGKIIGRLALVVLAVELLYVVAANIVLSAGWLKDWANADDFFIGYESAYSVLPGRVHVEGFVLRTADSNLQIELGIDQATVDVSLHQLFFKRFRGQRLRAQGTSFKLRYKLDEIGQDALRVEAYPEIRGYEGAPLREPPKPSKSPTAEEAEPWTVSLADVIAQVKELWIVEYRFLGKAVASGSFEMTPGQFLALTSSKLEFTSGALRVGERLVAERLAGTLKSRIDPTQLKQVSGAKIFEKISAELDATLRGGDLEFLSVYLEPHLNLSASGPLRADLDIGLERGSVSRASKAELRVQNAALTTGEQTVRGPLMGNFRASSDSQQPSLHLSLSSEKLVADGDSAPIAHDLEATMQLVPLDVSEPLVVTRSQVSLQQLEVPELGWFEHWLADHHKLEGSAKLRMHWKQQSDVPPLGNVALSVTNFVYRNGQQQLRMGAELSSSFQQSTDAKLAFSDFRLAVTDASLATAGERSGTWNAVAKSNSLRLLRESPALQGTFDVSVDDAQALLPLVLPELPARLVSALVDVDQLETRLALYVSGTLERLEVLKAESGPFNLQGSWVNSGGDGIGAFVLRNDLINFGLRVKGDSVDVTVSPDANFLSHAAP